MKTNYCIEITAEDIAFMVFEKTCAMLDIAATDDKDYQWIGVTTKAMLSADRKIEEISPSFLVSVVYEGDEAEVSFSFAVTAESEPGYEARTTAH